MLGPDSGGLSEAGGRNCVGRGGLFGETAGCASAPVFADHQLQPGPDRIDRSDLDVDQVELQRLGADHVLGDVGRDLRRLLRPRHPDHAVALQGRLKQRQAGRDLGMAHGEGMDQVEPRLALRLPRRADATTSAKATLSASASSSGGSAMKAATMPGL